MYPLDGVNFKESIREDPDNTIAIRKKGWFEEELYVKTKELCEINYYSILQFDVIIILLSALYSTQFRMIKL